MQPFTSLPDLKIYWYGHDYDHYLDDYHTFYSHHPRHHHYNPYHDHLHHDIVAVQEETLNLCLAAAPEVTTVVLEQVRSRNHYNHHDHHHCPGGCCKPRVMGDFPALCSLVVL